MRIRSDGFEKTERVIGSPQAPEVELEGGARVVNFCANNYLGLADDPRLVAAAREASSATASAWRRCASSAARKRCTRQLEAAIARVPRHRRRDPLLALLRRQRRPVRDAARRRGRGHQRRAEPRQHHRRHPAVQGEALPLRQQRHGRSRGEAAGSGRRRRALQADRDRRRVLDGRHHRRSRGRSATSRTATARW